jgi:hypothetical protein
MNKAVADDATKAAFVRGSMEGAGGPPSVLANQAREDSIKYERLVRELNIRTS